MKHPYLLADHNLAVPMGAVSRLRKNAMSSSSECIFIKSDTSLHSGMDSSSIAGQAEITRASDSILFVFPLFSVQHIFNVHIFAQCLTWYPYYFYCYFHVLLYVDTCIRPFSVWWNDNRVDYLLETPWDKEGFDIPPDDLVRIIHSRYWEAKELVSFILRQVRIMGCTRRDFFVGLLLGLERMLY